MEGEKQLRSLPIRFANNKTNKNQKINVEKDRDKKNTRKKSIEEEIRRERVKRKSIAAVSI